jgi:CheY-like chemotaxis protein
MPEMNGYQLARHIRECEARNAHERVPIIACTANALGGEAENCLAAGMDDYLAKPIDLYRLAHTLYQWLPPSDLAGVAVPAASVVAAIIEPGALSDVSGGDPVLEREVLQRFREYNTEDAAALFAAVERRDAFASKQASHRIKGASRTIGAIRLADACQAVEHAAHFQDWDAMHAAMPAFRAELSNLESYIDSMPAPQPQ